MISKTLTLVFVCFRFWMWMCIYFACKFMLLLFWTACLLLLIDFSRKANSSFSITIFQILLMRQHHIVRCNSSIDFCIDVSCHILCRSTRFIHRYFLFYVLVMLLCENVGKVKKLILKLYRNFLGLEETTL